mmetsp:Transcript_7548/g.15510  ORF Transcript_7548/g.15510 Transcript_7548/m.15510 type:complete len:92 (-) Transcript_7548:787-1062(-)
MINDDDETRLSKVIMRMPSRHTRQEYRFIHSSGSLHGLKSPMEARREILDRKREKYNLNLETNSLCSHESIVYGSEASPIHDSIAVIQFLF